MSDPDVHKSVPLRRPLWTPGVLVMLVFMLIGAAFIIARFTGGIAAVSNLSTARPWGLWVGIDVATGVALAAGGFTTAFLTHILGRHYYESLMRPALLTAMLGYTFVVLGLLIDIGRSWAIWKPMIFWNTNSVLFEVAMCVMVYLTVLYIEFMPIVIERFKSRPGTSNRRVQWLLKKGEALLGRTMWIFIVAGVVLSCMHQSSLGSLMLITPTKLHPLWYTPILPLLFLTSAIAVGFPMVIFEGTLAKSSLQSNDEMALMSGIARFTPVILGIYLSLKIGDMLVRGTWIYLFDNTMQSNSFLIEVGLGVIAPMVILLNRQRRNSQRWLFFASCCVIGGVVFNRVNVFIIGYKPPFGPVTYSPAVGEIFITCGLIATLMFLYRVIVTYLPVLAPRREDAI
ncbi:NrfD/PsrC family molybdoenzyme membrane anchor subunit [Trichloromonas sp.]|uniref:NrfD/PsrC family molybdoenzyme membrane anchor subunit n=1 Tax=Trichloromonas sp. TaxID=3069249 RepID=UPI002A48651F|nr:Ni/Fe-hydrogenase cytochrome b subunit [Trichloromonas sp.]